MFRTPATVKDIFLAALDKPTSQERAIYLKAVFCEGDEELRREVEVLLAAHDQPDSRFDHPPHFAPPLLDAPCPPEDPTRIGTMVGPYKLHEQIGEGGMGLVYMAEQQRPVRRLVALKIIKPGFDSKQTIARFEAERQALALMDHPNIAKVLDAGTTEAGRPYFVMELVRGIPIHDFCDQRRLTVRERLELFVQVCLAIQHAHQKGIIHRDLKPTNILVTLHDTAAVPKVIDFGIAKALSPDLLSLGEGRGEGVQLTEQTLLTSFAQMIGTPLYMSPEQADMNQLGVDTRSDVYSLGVLLYQLLTGSTPFDKERLRSAGFDEMRRMIREDEPPRPSRRVSTLNAQALSTVSQQRGFDERQLKRTLRNELDWIVMKCLEKDRSRRYGSASALARDIERFLANEPISARPTNLGYRIRKWIHRNPASAIVGTVVALAAVALASGGWYHNYHLKQVNLALDETNRELSKSNRELNSAFLTSQRLRDEAIKRERDLRMQHYGNDLRAAWKSWNEGHFGECPPLLARHVPQPGQEDIRGIEWHLLNAHFPPPSRTFRGHDSPILTADVSPNGKWIASGDSRGWVKIWELATGRELKSFQYDEQEVKCVRFSPNGQSLATTGMDRKIHLWNTEDWEETKVFSNQDHTINRLAWSPDGKQIAFGGFDNKLLLLNVDQHDQRTLIEFREAVRSVAWSPDGKVLAATAKEDGLYLCDTTTWKSRRVEQEIGAGSARALAFTSNSKWLASAGYGGRLAIHDVAKHTSVSYFETPDQVSSLRFSPDDKRLLVGMSDGAVLACEIDSASGKLLATQAFLLGEGNVNVVAFSEGGRKVVTAFESGKVVDVHNAAQLGASCRHRYSEPCYSISPSLKHACTIETPKGVARLVSFPPGQDFGSLQVPKNPLVRDAQFLPPGDRLALRTDSSIYLFEAPSQRYLGSLTDTRINLQKFVRSPDGKLIAGSGTQGDVYKHSIWETDTRSQIGSNRHAHRTTPVRMAISPNNQLLATASFDGPIYLWDIGSGKQLAELPDSFVFEMEFSPDGQTLSVAAGKDVSLWDVQSFQKAATLRGHTEGCMGLAFSPGGRTLASVSGDKTARLWHIPTLQELCVLTRHSLPLTRVEFLTPRHLAVFSDPDPSDPHKANDIFLFDVGNDTQAQDESRQTLAVKGTSQD